MLSRFIRLDRARWPILWVVGLFMVQAIPAAIIRASNLEEGRIIGLARGALEDSHWITPFIYGERFPERPILMSWVTAAFGEMTGGVTLWSLRIPHLASFLVGAVLIYSIIRSNAGSKSASIFGALCWMCMPMVAAKFINAEADVFLSTLLFAAFYVWWRAEISKRLGLRTWLAIGLLVGLGGLTKGPQPMAYFALGVGPYLLLKDRDQIGGFLTANFVAAIMTAAWYLAVRQPNDIELWMAHSRLVTTQEFDWFHDHLDFIKSIIIETLPAAILIAPAIAIALRTWRNRGHDLLLASCLYAIVCTLVLILWPGGVAARYAMPATMALAVMCGIVFDLLRRSHERVIVSALFITCLIYTGIFIRGWIAMPFWPHLFQESQRAGNAIDAAFDHQPDPLYVIGTTTDFNMLVYVRRPIRSVTLDELSRLEGPAVALLQPEEESTLRRTNPSLQVADGADIISQRMPYRIVKIQRR